VLYSARKVEKPAAQGAASSVNARYFFAGSGSNQSDNVRWNTLGERARRCAVARSGVQPGRNRPSADSHQTCASSVRPASGLTMAAAQIGSATSKDRPTSTPRNVDGVTPMMSNACPSSRTVRPSTAPSPPYSRCQNAWLITAPVPAQPGRSSA
jgi:hypothetical protein